MNCLLLTVFARGQLARVLFSLRIKHALNYDYKSYLKSKRLIFEVTPPQMLAIKIARNMSYHKTDRSNVF